MSLHSAVGKCGKVSYIELIAAPFWLFATRSISDWIPPEWVVAAALSFVAYLFVRRR